MVVASVLCSDRDGDFSLIDHIQAVVFSGVVLKLEWL